MIRAVGRFLLECVQAVVGLVACFALCVVALALVFGTLGLVIVGVQWAVQWAIHHGSTVLGTIMVAGWIFLRLANPD